MCVAALAPTLRNIIVTAIFGLGLLLRAKCEEDLLVRAEGYGIFRNRVKNLFFSAALSAPAGHLVRAAMTKLRRRDFLCPGTIWISRKGPVLLILHIENGIGEQSRVGGDPRSAKLEH
jgi:ABC-type branched-subunit amino acid transport system permease subunit